MTGLKVRDKEHADELVFSVSIPKDNTTGNIVLPAINLQTDVVNKLNTETEKYIEYKNKVSAEAKNLKQTAYYEVGYAAYVYDDILSIAIRCSYQIGSNTQVVDVCSYNYDIKNDKLVTMKDIIDRYNIDSKSINDKIAAIIERKKQSSRDVVDSGYNGLYDRDVESDKYKLENSDNFLLTDQGELFIIYSYAREKETATFDVIKTKLPNK